MKTIQYITLVLLGLTVFNACTENIDLNLDNTYTRLVVDGLLTTDTTAHCVKLRKSVDFDYGKALPPVSGALVTIWDGNSLITLNEDTAHAGNYYTAPDYYGVAGHSYTLTISNVDIDGDLNFETYTAKDTLIPVGKADSIKVLPSNFAFITYDIRFWGQEPGNSHDFYLFKLRKNNVMLTDTITETFPSDDVIYNGSYLKNMTVYNLFKNKADEKLKEGDTITLEMSSISKAYNQFLTDLQFETQGSSPFGGQPANLSSNFTVKDKVVGFFATYDINRTSYIMKKEDIVNKD